MKSFNEFTVIVEAKLVGMRPAEWKKNNSKTNEPRTDILIRLIKDGTPVQVTSGKLITIENSPELIETIDQWFAADAAKNAAIGFVDVKGNPYTTSDIVKAAIFGGGAGAGGGTQGTKEVESHQCAMLQAMLDNGQQEMDFFTDEVIADAYKKIFVDASLDEVLKANNSDQWKTSSYWAAVYLINNNYVNKGMTFHRGDRKMNLIYVAKKLAFKNNGFPVLKDDKWNPGDIWAMTKGFDPKRELPIDNVRSLNDKILELYTERELVGISLKLVKKENPPASEHNVKSPPDTDDHKLMNITAASKKGNFFSAKSGFIFFDEGRMEVRANAPGSSVKCEITGKTSRGGSAGWGVIIPAMEQVFKKRYINKFNVINAAAKKIIKGDKKEIKKLYDMYLTLEANMTLDQFTKELAKKDYAWVSAKYGVMYILSSVQNESSRTKQNRWVTKIVNYAGSKSEDSSAYIKIGK